MQLDITHKCFELALVLELISISEVSDVKHKCFGVM